ncbi:MAG TPA: hypothetical protein VJ801_15030 [Polyangia bacterium]|nr:hypothetical protein [Polyangia bacterium]
MGSILSVIPPSVTSHVGSLLTRVTPISSQVFSALSRIYSSTRTSEIAQLGVASTWRPPQWIHAAMFTVSVADAKGNQTVYVFDGVIRASHEQRSVVTLNPVQTGAAISDHAYIVPARLVLEISQSDAMQSYDVRQWADGPSKSVSAYQTLVALQKARQVLQVATRLRQYDKMLISEVHAEESEKSRYGLKAIVTFTEILTASVEATSSSMSFPAADSELPQTTGETMGGQVPTAPVPANIQSQNSMSSAISEAGSALQPIASSIPGAGTWSSSSAAAATSLFS